MKLGSSFLHSKLGRRIFFLFMGCAFIPTLFLLVLSVLQVQSELEHQSKTRLLQETKAYGMALFDRLKRMDNLLKLYGVQHAMNGHAPSGLSQNIFEQYSEVFASCYLFEQGKAPVSLLAASDEGQIEALFRDYVPQAEKSSIAVHHFPEEEFSSVFMLTPLDKEQPNKGFLAARMKTNALWGIGEILLLPALTELSVYDGSDTIIQSYAAPSDAQIQASGRVTGHNLRYFEYSFEGSTYLASTWSLFLPSGFNTQPWTIIFSQAKQDMLAPLAKFKRVFPLIVLLCLWIILFLSLYFIRKTVAPVEKLQEGTRRIAAKDFATRVEVQSGDEFQALAESFNTMTTQLNKQFNALEVIGKIDRTILSSLDKSVVVTSALKMMQEFFAAELVLLGRLITEQESTLQLAILERGDQIVPDTEYVTISPDEYSSIFNNSEHSLLVDTQDVPRFLSPFANDRRRFLSLPLLTDRKFIGTVIMTLDISTEEETREEIQQARQIADQLAVALSNVALVENLERLSIGTVEALARTVDAKSQWTAGHSERVAELSVKIGRAMGFDADNLDLLYRGGLLHDIGKIGVPITILDKPGKLDDDEFKSVRSHPEIGEKILQPIKVYKDILPIVVQHHERFDGKGYPEGLAGSEIDLNARVLAVADVYDALISKRPYRDGWVRDKVHGFLIEQSGKMFDPQVVDIFIAISA